MPPLLDTSEWVAADAVGNTGRVEQILSRHESLQTWALMNGKIVVMQFGDGLRVAGDMMSAVM
jgi:hypothetical protein